MAGIATPLILILNKAEAFCEILIEGDFMATKDLRRQEGATTNIRVPLKMQRDWKGNPLMMF